MSDQATIWDSNSSPSVLAKTFDLRKFFPFNYFVIRQIMMDRDKKILKSFKENKFNARISRILSRPDPIFDV